MLTASNVLVKSEIDETLAVGVDGADGRFVATSLVMAATTQRIYDLDRLQRRRDRGQKQD
jgi:hypothetical protein